MLKEPAYGAIGVDYSTVKQAAFKLLSRGINPSVQKIRDLLGTGSNITIAEHLSQWREEYAQKRPFIIYQPPCQKNSLAP